MDGRFRLPALHAGLFKKALQALTAPRRIGEGRSDPESGKKLPASTLLGQGFMDLAGEPPEPRHPAIPQRVTHSSHGAASPIFL